MYDPFSPNFFETGLILRAGESVWAPSRAIPFPGFTSTPSATSLPHLYTHSKERTYLPLTPNPERHNARSIACEKVLPALLNRTRPRIPLTDLTEARLQQPLFGGLDRMESYRAQLNPCMWNDGWGLRVGDALTKERKSTAYFFVDAAIVIVAGC